MKSNPLLLCIILLFGMLWLPLGQYPFLLDHWMKVGTYAIPFLLIGAFSFYQSGSEGGTLRFWGIAFLIAYILHQFEEHWIDVLGNTYAFYAFNNSFVKGLLEIDDPDKVILTKGMILLINTSLVWMVGLLAIQRSPKHNFPLIAMASITVVNAFVHIMGSLVSQAYNPGLLTSLLVFIPIYFIFLRRVNLARNQVIAGIIWAVVGHALMIWGMLATSYLEIIPEWTYYLLLALFSVLPVFLFRSQA
ncbi:MAG: HXXEE domain-containing protein [Bacteroidota bacterium]